MFTPHAVAVEGVEGVGPLAAEVDDEVVRSVPLLPAIASQPRAAPARHRQSAACRSCPPSPVSSVPLLPAIASQPRAAPARHRQSAACRSCPPSPVSRVPLLPAIASHSVGTESRQGPRRCGGGFVEQGCVSQPGRRAGGACVCLEEAVDVGLGVAVAATPQPAPRQHCIMLVH